jgi:hypothetical protein
MTYKFILALFALFITTTSMTAQEELLDKLAQSACDCISAKDTDNLSQDEIQMQMGFCIMEAVGKYPEEFSKAYGDLDFTDQAAMTKLGEDIGYKMAFKCPTVLMNMALMETQTTTTTTTTESQNSISGTLQSIEGDDFSLLVVKDASGRAHKLLWLSYFEGSEALSTNPGNFLGKQVSVDYTTYECYSPKIKDYINCKEITRLSFK